MKLILVSLAIISCFGFSISKKKKFIPPGTIQINDTLFADETEVSNLSWNEYMFWMKNIYGNKSKEYLSSSPDAKVWGIDTIQKQDLFSTKAYRNYPVVAVSYEQVVAFCKWRTERVREFMWLSKKYDLINFEYRLPTKKEWELLSNGGSEFSNNCKTDKGLFKFNCTRASVDTTLKLSHIKYADIFTPVYSYWSNRFGLWNMIGNVSEMVLEKNISKGGSWRHQIEECRIGKDIPYSTPTNWLGFRCVCVIKR